MNDLDIRWQQRFQNYRKALALLNEAANVTAHSMGLGREVEDLMKEGLIQRFEYTHELAWNVLKDYSEYQGNTDIKGSRDAIRYGLQTGLITDKAWMKSIEDRNLSSHHYDSSTAEAIITKVVGVYLPLFNSFEETMTKYLEL
jgi:nucleotidyltransferase substrate binding protein (TIGR01987 family)